MKNLITSEFSQWIPTILEQEFNIKLPQMTRPSKAEVILVDTSLTYNAIQKEFEGQMWNVLVHNGKIVDISIDKKSIMAEFDCLDQVNAYFL